MFQYIPCYSLSQQEEQSKGREVCFNTSHVTLYLCLIRKERQMLASFNTSHVTLYLFNACSDCPLSKFQYIPCYSLSVDRYIYKVPELSFNTSHVTLYQYRRRRQQNRMVVSIHPMLLFIADRD